MSDRDNIGGMPFWDGIEAMWGYRPSNGYTYIRFRNYDNPNGKDLRISRGPPYNNSTQYAAVRLLSVRHNTLRNFHVAGSRCGIGLDATTGNEVSHCIVESNFVEHGYNQIALNPAAMRTAISNVIRFNVLTPNRYGFADMGAWDPSHPDTWPRYNAYWFNKMQYGDSSNVPHIIFPGNCGNGNMFVGNILTNGFDGIDILGGAMKDGGLGHWNNYRQQPNLQLFHDRIHA